MNESFFLFFCWHFNFNQKISNKFSTWSFKDTGLEIFSVYHNARISFNYKKQSSFKHYWKPNYVFIKKKIVLGTWRVEKYNSYIIKEITFTFTTSIRKFTSCFVHIYVYVFLISFVADARNARNWRKSESNCYRTFTPLVKILNDQENCNLKPDTIGINIIIKIHTKRRYKMKLY